MPKDKQSTKNLVIFWVFASLALWAWQKYLSGNTLSAAMILSFMGGILVGLIALPAENFFKKNGKMSQELSGNNPDRSRKLAKLRTTERAKLEITAFKQKKDMIWNRQVPPTPQEVRERLKELLKNKV